MAPKFLSALKVVPKLVASDRKIGPSWMLVLYSPELGSDSHLVGLASHAKDQKKTVVKVGKAVL